MISKCVFPCAGFGTRFLPVTKTIPKEMLPISSRPLIEYSINEAFESDVTDMVIILNKYKLSLKDYFVENIALNELIRNSAKESRLFLQRKLSKMCNFDFIEQEDMLGLGHAIFQAKGIVGNSSFAVILPDDLCYSANDNVLQQMINIHNDFPDKCILALERVDDENLSKYGVIDGVRLQENPRLFHVSDLIEKPQNEDAPSNFAIIGRYIFTNDIFDAIEDTVPDENGEIQITNALKRLAKIGKVIGYEFEGKRLDCGTNSGYLDANIFFKDKF